MLHHRVVEIVNVLENKVNFDCFQFNAGAALVLLGWHVLVTVIVGTV